MDTYGAHFERLKAAFVEFIHRMPFYGAAILCSDDAGVRSIMPMISRPIVTYGFGADADGSRGRCRSARRNDAVSACSATNGVRMPDLRVSLNLPGDHNVLNALAAIAVAPNSSWRTRRWSGPGRVQRRWTRFQHYGEQPVSAHGETQGRSRSSTTTDITRSKWRRPWLPRGSISRPPPGARLSAAPLHTHARLLRRLRQGDRDADLVLLLPRSMPAGEAPIVAADGRALARALRVAGKVDPVFVDDIADMAQAILEHARDGDVVIAMGAGSIGNVPAQVSEMSRPALRPAARCRCRNLRLRRRQPPKPHEHRCGGLRQGCRPDGRRSAEREISLMSGTGVLERCGRRAWMRTLRSGRAGAHRPEARRLRALLHRAARPPRRGRHRARRARVDAAFRTPARA